MIQYLKTGYRNLLRRKGVTLVNLVGLTTGMVCCLLIFHYVSYEKSFDTGLKNADSIYRIQLNNYQKGELAWKSATVYPGIPGAMKSDFPEVVDFCKLIDAELTLSTENGSEKFKEEKGYYAEQSFIEMFDLQLISGVARQALTGPGKILISEDMSVKYFGIPNGTGKMLVSRGRGTVRTYEVSGVFKKFRDNSHLKVEYLVSYDELRKQMKEGGDTIDLAQTAFDWYDFYAYIQIKKGTEISALQKKMPDFCKRHMDKNAEAGFWHEIFLIPLPDIHLYSNVNQEAEVNGDGEMVNFLFLIAIFIICIAWVNYINLTTARSVERAKEVGIKKVLGASRTNVIWQFMVENFLFNFICFAISFGICYLLLPSFDKFAGYETATRIALLPKYWMIFSAIFLAGAFISGIYPAFILSSFRSVRVLKGSFKTTSSGLLLRRLLIGFQFTVTVVLIVGTIVVFQQVQFMRSQHLGANIHQTLVINGPASVSDSLYVGISKAFKNELKSIPGIKNVCASTNIMGKEIYWTNMSRRMGTSVEAFSTLYNLGIDQQFVDNYEMKIIAGKKFEETDRKTVMLNESASRLMGFANPGDAAGQKIINESDTLSVCGVLADFHQQTLRKPVDPMLIRNVPNARSYFSVKLNVQAEGMTDRVADVWKRYYPNDPFNYFFLDEHFDHQYASDVLFGKVFSVFSIVAILVACVGLLGLSAYNILQRQKEIGMRKVMGASQRSILFLLSSDYIKIIVAATLIAMPVAFFLLDGWLNNFPYRINIKWWVFILAGFIALIITLITLLLQALKVIRENPVKNLRTE